MTEKMSATIEKKEPPQQERLPEFKPNELIPVGILVFSEAIDIPGIDSLSSSNVKWNREPGRRGWELHFLPWLRHHRITYFDPQAKAPAKEFYVHESKVKDWQRK